MFSVACKRHTGVQERKLIIGNSLTIFKWGLPSIKQPRAMNTVAEKYDFHFKSIAGCILPKEWRDRVFSHNDSVYAILQAKYGKRWRIKFANEVDSMMALQENLLIAILAQPYIAKENQALDKMDKQLFFDFDITRNKNVLDVKAYDYEMINDRHEKTILYRMLVNIKTRVIITI